jgi:hypothetical protein
VLYSNVPPRILDVLAAIATQSGAKFASFLYRAKESGELARHTLILGASITELYRKDVEELSRLIVTATGIELQAAQELHSSRVVSLTDGIGNNPANTNAETYDETPVKGIKIHRVTREFHATGLSVQKNVIEPGTYPADRRRPLTKAKDAIRAVLPSGKFRQFALGNLIEARVNGETIELDREALI